MATNIVWPVTVREMPVDAGLTESQEDTVIRTQMEVGPPKIRQRSGWRGQTWQMRFVWTEAEVTAFDTWLADTIAGGALSFLMNNPRTGTEEEMILTGPPSYSHLGGGIYSASLTMMRLAQVLYVLIGDSITTGVPTLSTPVLAEV
jgi:hypothetical protein